MNDYQDDYDLNWDDMDGGDIAELWRDLEDNGDIELDD